MDRPSTVFSSATSSIFNLSHGVRFEGMDEIYQNIDQFAITAEENQISNDCSGDVDITVDKNIEDNAFVNRSLVDNDNLMGMVVNSEEEAYDLYNQYAIRKGFSMRRSKTRHVIGKSNTKEIRSKEYCCSKAGIFDGESNSSSTRVRNKFVIKSDCKAMIRFKVEDGLWTVNHFIVEHNHELASPSKSYLLRSNRSISGPKANLISSMVNAGIKTRDVYAYISGEVGGAENVGFIKRDCYNEVNKQKMQLIEAGDAQSLIKYFKKQESMDSMFSYDIQVDQDSRLTNFFWRDGKSAIDYDYFGDVVIFDTTYRTNRYNLVCAPFIGLNHHRQNIMFGCAFLLDETIESFVWLFETFLSSMGGKAPKTIFTDQDQAMANAIKTVFPDTCHRLCLWHLEKHFPSHLGSLNSNNEFQKFFKKCLYGCESESEFEDTFEKMLDAFDLREHNWLRKFYTLRSKWSLALSNDTFSAGLLSTQRSESTNSVLGGLANRTTSLTQFLIAFEKMVGGWRSSEFEEDFRCSNTKPQLSIKSGILAHAARVYTHKNFKLFEDEFNKSIGLMWLEVSCTDSIYTFEVKSEENSKVRHVRLDASTEDLSCSCKKFQSCGLLCCHVLRILNVKNFNAIPERYILRRWSKEARKRWAKGENSKVSGGAVDITYRNNMIRFAYDTILKGQVNEVTRTIVQDGLHRIDRELQVALEKLNTARDDESKEDGLLEERDETDVGPILNPPRVKPKGVSNARLKGHFEKRKTKAKMGVAAKAIGKGKKKVSTARGAKDSNKNDQSTAGGAKDSNKNDHVVSPAPVLPSYIPHYQFSSSTLPYHVPPPYQVLPNMPPPYQVPPNMPLLNPYGVPLSYLNTGAANVPYPGNITLQNMNEMEHATSDPYTQQENQP